MSTDKTNAALSERRDLNDTLSIVRVQPDSGCVPGFEPGQFITLGLPAPLPADVLAKFPALAGRTHLTKRAYSIASSARDTTSYELFVVLVAAGKLTPKLWTLSAGDRLWMDHETKGEFTLSPVPPGRDLVMISTGTGIAPFLSMLRTYRGQERWRRFVVINGVRRVQDLAYVDELREICRSDQTVRYIPLVSREPWAGLYGRVHVALEDSVFMQQVGAPLDPESCHVFLCGNPAMTDDVEKLLQQRGFRTHSHESPGNLHVERYW